VFTTKAYVDPDSRIRCGHIGCDVTLGRYDDGYALLGGGRGWNLGEDDIWRLARQVERRIDRARRLVNGSEGQRQVERAKALLSLATSGDLRQLSQSDPHLDVDFGDATTRMMERAGAGASGGNIMAECWQCRWINIIPAEE
jgi:hypothetical protein